ncbi:MAG: bis-aminopropyl spermidine synthase family protein [Patescibacteria group bacterium]|nr:bis-aminopropyl spermidine synthase family protein [Patescibacteria group bacterium]
MLREKDLKKIYKKYLKLYKFYFSLDAKKHSTSLKELKLSDRILSQFFDNYVKPSFISFLSDVKTIIYSSNIYDFIMKTSSEDWDLWSYLKFLEREKMIKIKKNGGVLVLKKDILNLIPKSQNEEEIKKKIEKKLKLKIKEKESVINLFKKFQDFQMKAKWDQMPISQGSAIFVVKKILENIPLNKKFLLVGDDDFISVILGIADPKIESLVIDTDEQLLECIDILAQKFNLKIETRKVDIRKTKTLGEKFIGFLANPVYTEAGVRKFVKYGLNQLGEDGGLVFLEVGNDTIGNRFLFLQDFFNKNNLIIQELIVGKVFYPYIELYKEDKEILKRLSWMVDKKVIKNSPKLAASLYIFKYLPSRPKKVMLKRPIYAYL